MVDIFGGVKGLIYRDKDEWLPRPEGLVVTAKGYKIFFGGAMKMF